MTAHPDFSDENSLLQYVRLQQLSVHTVTTQPIEGIPLEGRGSHRRQQRRKHGARGLGLEHLHADPAEAEILFHRPRVADFNAFCSQLLANLQASTLLHQGCLLDINLREPEEPGASERTPPLKLLRLAGGETVLCRHLVLATGSGPARRPCWAQHLPTSHVRHVDQLHCTPLSTWVQGKTVLVVGGGMSAAHACLLLASHRASRVLLLSRHPLREQEFDADLSWFARYSQQSRLCEFYQMPAEVSPPPTLS
jgi:hypothetical protein